MSKITFECEVDVTGDDRIDGIELQLMRVGEWVPGIQFIFPRPQRVRNGKHIRISQSVATIVKVGDET